MMRATSKTSFEASSRRWERVLTAAREDAQGLGEQLYALADTIGGTSGLRRALTDPSRSGDDKAALVEQIFRGKVDDALVDLVQQMARSRWSAPQDLPHALEVLAVDSILAAAQVRGHLESVEDELFRIDRVLAAQRDLRLALSDADLPAERRVAVVEALFEGRVLPETQLFLTRATTTLRARSLTSAINAIGRRAAQRRERLVATVIAAAPLTERQTARLGEILERIYGRAVQVNVGVDENLIGGLRIKVGSEMVDATVLARLDEARRRLVA